jgi:hypothetical protein
MNAARTNHGIAGLDVLAVDTAAYAGVLHVQPEFDAHRQQRIVAQDRA